VNDGTGSDTIGSQDEIWERRGTVTARRTLREVSNRSIRQVGPILDTVNNIRKLGKTI
jgi:hypothetical protein